MLLSKSRSLGVVLVKNLVTFRRISQPLQNNLIKSKREFKYPKFPPPFKPTFTNRQIMTVSKSNLNEVFKEILDVSIK